MMMSAAEKYVRAIRNPAKRKYAEAYLRYLRTGGAAPDRPKDLSYMAAQAVRISLDEVAGPPPGGWGGKRRAGGKARSSATRPPLFHLRGKFYSSRTGKQVKAPIKPTRVEAVLEGGKSAEMWTWREGGENAWSGTDPRGKERTAKLRYHEWAASGRQKRALRNAGGKRRKASSGAGLIAAAKALKQAWR